MLGEAVSNSFDNLLPLLVLMGVVFVVFIGAALFLRYRMGAGRRTELARLKAARARGAAGVKVGELLVVMGRPFSVTAIQAVDTGAASALWVNLQDESGEGRLFMHADGSRVLHLPAYEGDEEQAASDFPETVDKGEQKYSLDGQFAVEAGWELAFYTGPMDRYLGLECKGGVLKRWCGRAVPYEGLEVREAEPDPGAAPPVNP